MQITYGEQYNDMTTDGILFMILYELGQYEEPMNDNNYIKAVK